MSAKPRIFGRPIRPGEMAKHVRIALGWSQQDMGERLEVHQGAVSRYERGARELSLRELYKLMRFSRGNDLARQGIEEFLQAAWQHDVLF